MATGEAPLVLEYRPIKHPTRGPRAPDVDEHPIEEDPEGVWPLPDGDETVSIDSFSDGELSGDSLEYSTSTDTGPVYLMWKGLMYKVVKKTGAAKAAAKKQRKRKKEVKPAPLPTSTDPHQQNSASRTPPRDQGGQGL